MARLINTTAMTVDGVIDVDIPLAAEFGGIGSLGKETQWADDPLRQRRTEQAGALSGIAARLTPLRAARLPVFRDHRADPWEQRGPRFRGPHHRRGCGQMILMVEPAYPNRVGPLHRCLPSTRTRHPRSAVSGDVHQAGMSAFSEAEIAYLQSNTMGRLATIGPDGVPHLVPLTYRFSPCEDAFDIGGVDFGNSKKWRDMLQNPHVAFLVDDASPTGRMRSRFAVTLSRTSVMAS
jgi:PPOX class F420-dependent enzyme/OxyR family protein